MDIFTNMIEPESGKTYKELNLEKIHNIPIGTLVEITSEDIDHGIRLHGIDHSRDCDGSPLYILGIADNTYWDGKMYVNAFGGWGEEDLIVIKKTNVDIIEEMAEHQEYYDRLLGIKYK